MAGDGDDVLHHLLDIGEHHMVHALKDIVGRIGLGGFDEEGVVDQAIAHGLDADGRACNFKLGHDVQKFLVHFPFNIKLFER